MKLIFIRHGEKEYPNGKNPIGKPAHDPCLLGNQEELIIKLTIALVNKYGKPDKLIVSPFNRTRQTAEIMRTILSEKYNKFCNIVYDKEVEEFLGFQKPKNKRADISDLTAIYTRPLLGIENLQECKKRIIDFYSSVEKNKNIWIITHGILISFLYNYLHEEKKNFACLDYLVI